MIDNEIDEGLEFAQRLLEERCLTCNSMKLFDNHHHCLQCILAAEYKLWLNEHVDKDIGYNLILDRWEEEGIINHMIRYERKLKDNQL